MNSEAWNHADGAIEMLCEFKKQSPQLFLDNVYKLQSYYISCCRRKLHLLPQKDFKKVLDLAESYIKKSNE
ncbi:hypothetical protein [Gynuella sp.]|uniref:hypothetical protein n=1 Tax=Gynuella sp. TaxID=2969146 RepID=UPI003D130818